MRPRWEDVTARARGLGTHLLPGRALDELAGAPTMDALTSGLERAGFPRPATEGGTSPAEVELAIRRAAAQRLRVVVRWLGARSTVLAVVLEDEDRRSLRALLRGALAGAAPEQRLAGLLPTPSLPERMLEELAKQPRPGGIAALLVAWSHPYGSALLQAASADNPSLFELESIINRTWAQRAVRAARNHGRELTGFVAEAIDLENTMAALILAGRPDRDISQDWFLPGGQRLPRERARAAAEADSPSEAGDILGAAWAGTAFRPAIVRHAAHPATLARAVLDLRIRALNRAGLEQPLGAAPLLSYLLRLRAELVDLQRIVWAVTLGAPGTFARPTLASA